MMLGGLEAAGRLEARGWAETLLGSCWEAAGRLRGYREVAGRLLGGWAAGRLLGGFKQEAGLGGCWEGVGDWEAVGSFEDIIPKICN